MPRLHLPGLHKKQKPPSGGFFVASLRFAEHNVIFLR